MSPHNGFPSIDTLVERYASRTGLDLTPLPWYVALGSYKLAVICEGIHAGTSPARPSGPASTGSASWSPRSSPPAPPPSAEPRSFRSTPLRRTTPLEAHMSSTTQRPRHRHRRSPRHRRSHRHPAGGRRPRRRRARPRRARLRRHGVRDHLGRWARDRRGCGRQPARAGGGGRRPRRRRAGRTDDPGQQRRHHPRQPHLPDDRGGLGRRDERAPARRVPDDQGGPGAHVGGEVRPDRQPLLHLRAGQPRAGQLLGRQGRAAGLHQDAGDRAGPLQRHRQRRRAGLHRHRHDPPDGRADEGQLRGLHRRGVGPDPGRPGRSARGHRQHDLVPRQRAVRVRLRPGRSTSPVAPRTVAVRRCPARGAPGTDERLGSGPSRPAGRGRRIRSAGHPPRRPRRGSP